MERRGREKRRKRDKRQRRGKTKERNRDTKRDNRRDNKTKRQREMGKAGAAATAYWANEGFCSDTKEANCTYLTT